MARSKGGKAGSPIPTVRLGIFPEVCAPVFIASAAMIFAFILFAAIFTETAEHLFAQLQEAIAVRFGWFYTLSVSVFLGFSVWLLLSRYGEVRLGDPGEEPRFGLLGWFAMLFSAGMGIGLLFWSVAEPIFHYDSPPVGEGGTRAAAQTAMRFTFFHWGLHAWGIYCVVGLALAYFAFRQKLPLAVRSAFYPLLGERIYGWPGHVVDTFAVFGTLFGVATSLGLGVMQINSGLNYLTGVAESTFVQVVLIAAVTAMATVSVVLGLSRGIQRLSQLNIILSAAILVFVLVAGPTLFLVKSFVENLGDYLQNLAWMSFWNDTLEQTGWQKSWTTFYWGWWIAWAPFVGMFIARVSRGRTIREFVAGVLFAPALATFVWLSVFGGTALHLELFGGGIVAAVKDNVSTALFVALDRLPLAAITATLATLIVVTFFVTSSDSGSLVIDMLTAGGHTDPPKSQRVFWAVTEGVVAAMLLVAGGLTALQTAAIAAGLPFCAIMLLMCYSLVRALRHEPITPGPEEEPEAPTRTMGRG